MASVREAFFNFRGDADDLIRELREIRQEIQKTPSRKKVAVEAQTSAAQTKLAALREQIEELEGDTHDVKISADLRKLYVQVAKAQQIIDGIPSRKVITLESRNSLDRDLGRAELLIGKATAGFGELARSQTQASRAAINFSGVWGRVSTALRRAGPLLMGLSIYITAALIPALMALGAAFGAVVTAITSAAAALAVGLGPAFAVMMAVFSRITAVMEAYRTRKSALDAETRKSAGATEREVAATEALRNALNTARDATIALTRAKQALKQARADAEEGLADAQVAEADAIRATAVAVEALRDTEVQAYRDIEDAIEAAKDAQLALQDAQLGITDANLALKRAQLELRRFRTEAGLSEEAFSDIFAKFSDVDVDLGGLRGALLAAGAPADEIAGEGFLELQEKLQAVRRAKLGVKESTDALNDAERDANRTALDAAKARADGVRGSDIYKGALENLAQAQRTQADASAQLAEMERLGIENAPAVVAARQAVRDAERRVAESRRDVKRATEELDAAEKGAASGGLALYEDQRKKLSEVERGLLDLIIKISEAYKQLRPLTDTVIAAITDSLGKLVGQMGNAQALLQPTADAIAASIRSIADNLGSFRNKLNFAAILGNSPKLVAALTEAFNGFLNALITLGTSALPLVIPLIRKVGAGLERIGSADMGGLTEKLKPMFETLELFMEIAVAAGDAVISTFVAAAEPINDFIKWIRDGIRAFAKFAKSKDGAEEIKSFFEDTLPVVKSVIKFVLTLGKTFLKVFQAFGPVLKPVIDVFTMMLEGIGKVADLINLIPADVRQLVGSFLAFGWVGKLIKGFGAIFTGMAKAIEFLGGKAKILGNIGGLLKRIGGFIVDLPGKVIKLAGIFAVRLAGGAIAGVGAVLKAIATLGPKLLALLPKLGGFALKLGAGLMRRVAGGIKGLGKLALDAGLFILKKLGSGIKSLPGFLADVAGWIVSKIGSGIKGVFSTIFGIGKFLLEGLVKGLVTIGKWVWDAIKGLADRIIDAVKKALGINSPSKRMYELGQWMLKGLINGVNKPKEVLDMVRNLFGSVPNLAKKLFEAGLIDLPTHLLRKISGGKIDIDIDLPDIPNISDPFTGAKWVAKNVLGFAEGGVIKGGKGGVMGLVGEAAHSEMVLPLTQGVFASLANSIASAMTPIATRSASPALAGGLRSRGAGGIHIDTVNLPPAPGHDQLGDPRVQAIQFTRELARRGGGGPSGQS